MNKMTAAVLNPTFADVFWGIKGRTGFGEPGATG
jgi:hypothetical protein